MHNNLDLTTQVVPHPDCDLIECSSVFQTATVSIDDCDTAIAVKFGHSKLLGNYTCAAAVEKHLPSSCQVELASCLRFLDLTGPFQIGGLPDLPTRYQVKNRNYVGCIRVSVKRGLCYVH